MAGTVTKSEKAKLMRALTDEQRNEAIDNSPNVHDLRPILNQRRRNRYLADFYRRASSSRPPDGLA